jgi:hypothetical protein
MPGPSLTHILLPWIGAILLTVAVLAGAAWFARRQGRIAHEREARGEFPKPGPLWPLKE